HDIDAVASSACAEGGCLTATRCGERTAEPARRDAALVVLARRVCLEDDPRHAAVPKRAAERALRFSASASRSRGGALVTSSPSRRDVTAATSATARSNAASFAFDGLVIPLTLRTNCSAAACTSSSVVGGAKL